MTSLGMKPSEIYSKEEMELLSCCTLCPRECKVNRFEGGEGYCGADAGMNIASICIHKGEEPPISGPYGICNIFFSGCNLGCVYCQNHEISRRRPGSVMNALSYSEAISTIAGILDKGIRAVGFVSPSHVVPQVKALIRGLKKKEYKPVTVYNTNSYEKPETLREIADLIDVYLPDYKYEDSEAAISLSDASGYPEVALKALKEIYFQKGSRLVMNDEGVAERGMLIRHLVLPGQTAESKKVMQTIAEELSTGIHISLMSQYNPVTQVCDHPFLSRTLTSREYNEVAAELERLGFRNGWLQGMDSFNNYLPDFSRSHPFE